MNKATKAIQDLLPTALIVVTEAARREDITVRAVHLSDINGVSVFVDNAGQREHLANALGIPPEIHTSRHGNVYRESVTSLVTVRIYGRDSE